MTQRASESIRVRRSVVAAHRANEATPAHVQRAYLRFSWARRKAAPRFGIARWLLAGVAVGVGVASAASQVQTPKLRAADVGEIAQVAASVAKRSAGARTHSVSPNPIVETELVPVASTPDKSANTPWPAPPAMSAPRSVTPRAVSVPSAASASSASDWQRAAAALRNGDVSAAQAALGNLQKSDSLLDRQAAELAAAQLLASRGQNTEAIGTLRRLARDGASPGIRSQAASTLRSLGD